MISGAEPPSFATKPILPSGIAANIRSGNSKHVLNATLADLDERGLPNAFLAEKLPELNTVSWRVFPTGQMETTYLLRPGLTWQDGKPLTAEDFVFAWRVYAKPELGVSRTGPMGYLDEVAAPDPRTVVVRWNQLYAEAGGLESDLPPLPRHILDRSFEDLSPDAFTNLAFWTDEYIGAGPWRLDRREPGAFFEAVAFDGFVFGRPKIDRVRVIYIADANTAVATLLAGEAHLAIEGLLYGEEGLALERGWGPNGGKVIWEPTSGRSMEIQMRPEYAVPRELATDVRVRQGLASLIDKEAMVETVTANHGLLREIYSHPRADYYEPVSRSVPTRYRYDERRAQTLLEQAGFARGSDGVWAGPSGRFTLEQWYIAGATNERESTILVDGLRRFGIDASSHVWGAQRTSAEERAKTSGIFGGTIALPVYHSRDIARPETRWTGANRLGFATAALDRALDAYDMTLDRQGRVQDIIEMERIAMGQLPSIVLYYNPRVIAHAADLVGVVQSLTPEATGTARKIWSWSWQA